MSTSETELFICLLMSYAKVSRTIIPAFRNVRSIRRNQACTNSETMDGNVVRAKLMITNPFVIY